MSPRRRLRLRRRGLIVVTVVAIAVAATVVVLVTRGGDTASAKTILARPAAYQITYRVDSSATGSTVTTWEVLTVHRPYAASDVVYGTDPGAGVAVPKSASLFDEDGLYTLDGTGAVRKVAGRQPGPAGTDQALGVELDQLVARKLASLEGTRTIAGRRCRVVRFAEPPSGAIKPLNGADHDDLCLDHQGLVLGEHWVLRGRVVYDRVATRALVGDVPDPVRTQGAKPLPPGGKAPTAVDGTDPSAPVKAPPTPSGFQPRPAEVFTLPNPSGVGTAARSTVWAFTRGADIISVEAGFESGGAFPWDGQPTPTANVQLPIGPATTALRSDGPEVRIPLGPGRWARVHGTVPLDELVSYARLLTAAP